MKLRIKGDSLRLRIAPSEMKWLMETGRVEDTVHFGADVHARLTYALEHADVSEMTVRYEPEHVAVVVPTGIARAWSGGDEVGVYGSVNVGGAHLELAIEKDWACVDKSEAENQDTFPHPNLGAAC